MDSNSSQQNDIKNNTMIKNNSDDFGVLLISHGSSLPYAEETFKEIHDKYVLATGHNTEVGYMKVAEPSISKAIDNLLDRNNNIKRIIAMPVFLAPGIHTNIDIPIILGLDPKETDPRCPDGNYPEGHYLKNLENINFSGEINLINCIGPDEAIIDIINKRVSLAIGESNIDIGPDKTGVLLVSHGSRLNYNREFITNIFNQYKSNTNYVIGQGFMELCEPSIAQAINNLTNNNDLKRLIVVPVFLAPGVHTTRDIPTILGLLDEENSANHSESHSHSNSNHVHDHSHHHHYDEEIEFNGEILYTEPLGADSLVIDVIKERINNEI